MDLLVVHTAGDALAAWWYSPNPGALEHKRHELEALVSGGGFAISCARYVLADEVEHFEAPPPRPPVKVAT